MTRCRPGMCGATGYPVEWPAYPLTDLREIGILQSSHRLAGNRMQSGRVKRREFVALLGGTAAWPLAARAQQPAMPVIGFLGPSSPDTFADRLRGFRQGLKDTGYVEGENITVDYRWAEGQYDRLSALVADLASPKGHRDRDCRPLFGIGGQGGNHDGSDRIHDRG
jgi:hypothetical protein